MRNLLILIGSTGSTGSTGSHAGGRSAMTCRSRCGDACFHEVPNTSTNEYVGDVIAGVLGRRCKMAGRRRGDGHRGSRRCGSQLQDRTAQAQVAAGLHDGAKAVADRGPRPPLCGAAPGWSAYRRKPGLDPGIADVQARKVS